jgi:hypothetical protein
VRTVERSDRVQVRLDWKHALGGPPFRLPEGASSVVLLDAEGHWGAGLGQLPSMALPWSNFSEALGGLLHATPTPPARYRQSPFALYVSSILPRNG